MNNILENIQSQNRSEDVGGRRLPAGGRVRAIERDGKPDAVLEEEKEEGSSIVLSCSNGGSPTRRVPFEIQKGVIDAPSSISSMDLSDRKKSEEDDALQERDMMHQPAGRAQETARHSWLLGPRQRS